MLNTPLTPELMVSDLDVSRKFWVDVLSFSIQYERLENRFVMLERQGVRFMLDEYDPHREGVWLTAALERPFGRGVNFEIETTDVDQLYKAVQASGAKIFLPLEDKWYRADDVELGNRQFIVLDPDGYMLRFVEDIGERPIHKS